MTRYGMVIDMNRCMGCKTCVVTCQLHYNQKPGMAWITVERLEWDEDRAYMPHACMHCIDAPCVDVCPVGATWQRDDGIVVVDYDKCIACRACMQACPYDARHISEKDVNFYGAEEQAPYEAYGTQRYNVVEKCVFCYERAEQGLDTYCTEGCPVGARIFGDVDDENSEVSKYIKEKGAEQLPNTSMYYVKGHHEFDLIDTLTSEGKSVVALDSQLKDEKDSDQGAKKDTDKQAGSTETDDGKDSGGVSPLAAGITAGVVGVAAGFGIGKATNKKPEPESEEADTTGKDGE